MKILVATRSLPCHGKGGMEYYAEDTCDALHNAGHYVVVLTTQCSDERADKPYPIHYLNNKQPGETNSAWWAQSQSKAAELIQNTGVDLIFSISSAGKSIAEANPDIPSLMQTHGTLWGEIRSKLSQSLLRKAYGLTMLRKLPTAQRSYQAFDKVISIGPQITKDLKSAPMKWLIAPEKVVEIRNGVDTTKFFPSNDEMPFYQRPMVTWRLVSVCRLVHQKGTHNALLALAQIPEANRPSLTIVGTGPDENHLKQLCRQLKLEHWVIFHGPAERKEIPDILRQHDVFLFLTERVEGLPLNVLEASACRLPVICSQHVQEGISDIKGIIGVSPTEHNLVANAITALEKLNDRPCLPKRYSLESAMKQYLEAIQ